MDRKSVPYEKDLDLAEERILGDRVGEAEDLESAELNRRVASLLKQPRMIEFMERLRSMDEAVR